MRKSTSVLTAFVAGLLSLAACEDRETLTSPALNASEGGGGGTQNTYSGEATVVRAVVPATGTDLTLVQAGPLPSSGGADEETLLSANVPGLLTANVLHATTVGQGQVSRSEASVADLSLTVGGNTITASLLMARVEARCSDGQPVLSGASHLAELVINGQAITVSGSPNQTMNLSPVGTVVINEQSATSNSITVNALHVVIPGIADVVISSAYADINCGTVCPPPHGDFVTGGGWIVVNGSKSKANFGVAGGIKQQGLWGHLTYIDHGSGADLKVKGTGVTGYEVVNPTTRRITGTADINGQVGTYEVVVSDQGEPGRGDTFKIILSTGYSAQGKLAGGNIQLHAKPGTTECP